MGSEMCIRDRMQTKHGWADIPRTLVHDKASYMVTPTHSRLSAAFAAGIKRGGFPSWVGSEGASADWLAKKFGDVYLHETAISHVRRLLDSDFAHHKLCETPAHFRQRMQQVEDHMHSDAFAAKDGTGLLGLCKQLRSRCKALVDGGGERLPF